MFKWGKCQSSSGKDYEEKSQRIYAWSNLIKSISKFLWIVVIIIILAALGKLLIFKTDKNAKILRPKKKNVVEKINWSLVNKDIENIMMDARRETEEIASAKLDQWIARNMKRVDEDFLNWYFNYWTQQKLGLQSLLAQVWHWVDGDSPTAAEKITLSVQEEFTNRVIRPQIAQLEMERMINEIITQYSTSLKGKLSGVPKAYHINPADWERYIEDISIIVKNVEGDRSTSLPLKSFVGLTAGGTIVLVRTLKPIITKIGARISTKLATQSAAKMAAKTGGKVAAKSGGKFLGLIIAVGIIIWDVWDHYTTKKEAMPVLRQNIYDYFIEVKESLLNDPNHGLMTIIYKIEQSVSIANRNTAH